MANAGKPARLVEILELQIFEEKSLDQCGDYFGRIEASTQTPD